MTHNFKLRFRRLLFLFLAIFLVLFLFRLLFGYLEPIPIESENVSFIQESSFNRNYASKEYKVKSSPAQQTAIYVDQKYEKIAQINTQSNKFVDEELKAKKAIDNNQGLIQFEQKSGNSGSRRLVLVIGVPPENFDALYGQLTQIGKVEKKQITKKDKTNEYKELNAKKASLEKIRASLIDLKSKSGRIDEYMKLENRILDIEQELQDLGVSLGDFDDEQEFCTVNFTLSEGKEVSISFLHRIKVAFEWTVSYYFSLALSFVFIVVISYLLLLCIEKFKILERILKQRD